MRHLRPPRLRSNSLHQVTFQCHRKRGRQLSPLQRHPSQLSTRHPFQKVPPLHRPLRRNFW